MLGKLIKYEFRASGRMIPLVYLVVVMLAVAGIIISAVDLYIFSAISFVLLFLAGAAAMIITYVVIFLRFYRGMFGSEGYLAMTLPVTPLQLYISKAVVAAVWMLLSGVVTMFAWISAMGSLFGMIMRQAAREMDISWSEFWIDFQEAMRDIPPDMVDYFRNLFNPGMIILIIFMGIVGYLAFTSQVFFCVTISNVKPFASLGIWAAILAYVVFSIVNSILSSALSYMLPLSMVFDPYNGNWSLTTQSMWSYMFDYSTELIPMGIGAYILPILYAFVLPIFTIRLIERKVNLK